jgi:hypothetical protein
MNKRFYSNYSNFLLPAIALFAAGGQEAQAQYLYTKAGLNFNNAAVRSLSDNQKLNTGTTAGLNNYTLGGGLGIKIKQKIDLQLGLDLSIKGFRDQFSPPPWERNVFWNIYKDIRNHKVIHRYTYFNLPLTVAYSWNVKDCKVFMQGGVFTGLGVWGAERLIGQHPEGGRRDEILTEVFLLKNQSGTGNYAVGKERGDRGLILGTGIEWDIFQFGMQYQHSTKNIARWDYEQRNRSLCLYLQANIGLK